MSLPSRHIAKRAELPSFSTQPLTSLGVATDSALLRVLDLMLAAVLLVLLLPVLLLIMLVVTAQDGASPLFAHRRYGRGGRTFLCYKIRSMAADADARLARLLTSDPMARAEWIRDHKLRDDPRVTRLGGFLRKTSLDELPQLINVLRGEMSFVGPRPIVAAEVQRYGRYFRNYCSVRPGITGIWQISGRNDIGYRRRVAMDCLLARRLTLRIYAEVLVGTALSVATRRGAY